jgi:transaldolase
MNRWKEIEKFGQSLWYDNLSRGFVHGGGLERMIEEVGLRGITSNPSIFEKSISNGREYDADIQSAIRGGRSTNEIYDQLTTDDVRAAADVMRTVYDATNGLDGYVSIEVDPRLAYKTEESVEAARRLWATIARPNIMIKIPGTPEGVAAVQQLLSEGININVTLLFGIQNYTDVANAYLAGAEAFRASGGDVTRLASVASFFLSRVDSTIDSRLAKLPETDAAGKLMGKAGVANAKLAYKRYQEIFSGPQFEKLRAAGARPQRCLWASVSTKNPAYSDVMYIEPLIGADTVTTVPDETIAAFQDHGKAANTLTEGMNDAQRTIARLRELGIDTEKVAAELQSEGVRKFEDAFGSLAANLEKKRHAMEEAMA